MGEARAVMDRLTDAMMGKDLETLASFYAPDAVVETPDAGELKGREQITQYMEGFLVAFPDARFEQVMSFEDGNVAIDEGVFVGTNTGPLVLPTGEQLPPTGKVVHVRECDIATVEQGHIVRHSMYFDQLGMLEQLGLVAESAG